MGGSNNYSIWQMFAETLIHEFYHAKYMIDYGCPSWDDPVFQSFLRLLGYTADEAGEHKLVYKNSRNDYRIQLGARAPGDPRYDAEDDRLVNCQL